MPYYVNGYEVERLYGGPEEGGWWYDAGTSTGESWGPYETHDDAMDVYYALQGEVDLRNEDRPPLHSVMSDGQFTVMVEDHRPVPYWPEVTPRYE